MECDQDPPPAGDANAGKAEKNKKRDTTAKKEKKDKKEKKSKKEAEPAEEYDYKADLQAMIEEIEAGDFPEEEKEEDGRDASKHSGKVASDSNCKREEPSNKQSKQEGTQECKEAVDAKAASVPRRCSSKKPPATEDVNKAAAAQKTKASEQKVEATCPNLLEETPQARVIKKKAMKRSDDEWSQDRQPDAFDSQ